MVKKGLGSGLDALFGAQAPLPKVSQKMSEEPKETGEQVLQLSLTAVARSEERR